MLADKAIEIFEETIKQCFKEVIEAAKKEALEETGGEITALRAENEALRAKLGVTETEAVTNVEQQPNQG